MRFLSTVRQATHLSLQALLANAGRSVLTMLGIIIGVGSVVVIMAIGAGAQSLILNQIQSLGTDLVGVLPGKSESDGPPASVLGIAITTLVYDDAQALANPRRVPNLVAVAPFSKTFTTVQWESETYDTNITGTSANYMEVEGGVVTQGRFFTAEENDRLARVAVLGSAVRDELFGPSDAVGQRISIKRGSFEVIGVMEERGTVAFQDYDDQIFIPISTMQKRILGINHLGFIRAKVDDEANIDRAVRDMAITLREQHGIDDPTGDSDDFSVRNISDALETVTVITDALRFFLAAMAALSLLVGGIGIMNIMLVSVTERTAEIGLRKAVGARERDILLQFLVEAVIVTVIGGAIGIVGGVALAGIIAVAAHSLGYAWDFVISPWSIIAAFGVASAIGIVFGLYPAQRAAKLEPIASLRYE